MTAKKLSLSEFVQSKQPPPCRLCVIPERAEVDEALRSGAPRRIVLEWLQEERGYKPTGPEGVSSTAMDKHCIGKHHYKGDQI